MENYVNHSGGCKGADMEWDRIGREYGFNNHKHYRPADLKAATPEVREEIEHDIMLAAISLGRPTVEFPGKDLVRRNWFQANGADAIFAISRIVPPGKPDIKGFINKTDRALVAGGTAWACEMAIAKGKPVHVFDVIMNEWYKWDNIGQRFGQIYTPVLYPNYAGIGTRLMSTSAIQAIRNVYLKTLEYETSTINGR